MQTQNYSKESNQANVRPMLSTNEPTIEGIKKTRPFEFTTPLNKVFPSASDYMNGGSGIITRKIGELVLRGDALLCLNTDGTWTAKHTGLFITYNGREISPVLEHFNLLSEMEDCAAAHVTTLFTETKEGK